MTTTPSADRLYQLMFPKPPTAVPLSEVREALDTVTGDTVARLVFAGRSPWRFLFDVLHGVVAVVDADGQPLAPEAIFTPADQGAVKRAITVTVRDTVESVLRARVLTSADDQWTFELLLRELEACQAEGSPDGAFEVAWALRDLLTAFIVDAGWPADDAV